MKSQLLCAALLILAGCSPGAGTTPVPDGGPSRDAGSSTSDGGQPRDAGELPPDSGQPTDAGQPTDGGAPTCGQQTIPNVGVAVDAWNHLVVTTPSFQFTYNLNVAPPATNLTQGEWWVADPGNNLLLGYAFGSVTVNGTTLNTTDSVYASRVACYDAISDALGSATRVVVTNAGAPGAGTPNLVQTFVFYPNERFFTAEVDATATGTFNGSTALSSNRLDVIDVKGGTVNPNPTGGSTADRVLLDVPFDNDAWVRYDARTLSGTSTFWGTSYEVTAVYENQTRQGLVIGSINHDFWKTGIFYQDDASAGPLLDQLDVFAGVTTGDDPCDFNGPTYGKDGTHDWIVPGGSVLPHGFMSGATVTSPRVLIGWYPDWRDGMERFGWANGQIQPPLRWDGGATPGLFGWMSYGAYGNPTGNTGKLTDGGAAMTNANLTAVSNDLKTLMGQGFQNNGTDYFVIDENYWDNTPGDYAALVQTIHANGQKAGGYLAPFWGGNPANVVHGPNGQTYACGGHTCTFADLDLQDGHGNTIQEDGFYALDVTHPAVRQYITDKVNNRIAQGVDLLKLDFLTLGSLEGAFTDPSVHSGIQAYNQIMAMIDGVLASHPNIFIAESIAPLFPGGYAHSRRISCDLEGKLNSVMNPQASTGIYWYPWASTEYGLNSLTFGWWLSPSVYPFNDGDEMALNRWTNTSPSTGYYATAGGGWWPYARRNQAIISGGLYLDASDYSDATAFNNSSAYLSNPGINHVAALGRSFRPASGSVGYVGAGSAFTTGPSSACPSAPSTQQWFMKGSQAGQVFYTPATASDPLYLAVFNYDDANATTLTVSFADLGLSSTQTFTVKSVSTGATLATGAGSFSVTLAPGQPAIYSVQ